MLAWLDKLHYAFLVPGALLMLLAPFFPEPHAWEKIKMLAAGTLKRPIDIFDLFFHSILTLILIAKILRDLLK